ncbi:MAG: hypothetical protein ACLUDU_06580 [Butyricimonas faecihominis]
MGQQLDVIRKWKCISLRLTFDEVLVIDNAVRYGYDACFFGYSSSYQYFVITINLLSILRRNKATSSSNYFEDYIIRWCLDDHETLR